MSSLCVWHYITDDDDDNDDDWIIVYTDWPPFIRYVKEKAWRKKIPNIREAVNPISSLIFTIDTDYYFLMINNFELIGFVLCVKFNQ